MRGAHVAGERVLLVVDEVADNPVRDFTQDFSERLVLGVGAERLEGFLAREHADLDEVDTLALVQVLHDLPGDDATFEAPALLSESLVLLDDVPANFFGNVRSERNEHDVPVHWRISSRVTLHFFSILVNRE